jgi:hypothetical protein
MSARPSLSSVERVSGEQGGQLDLFELTQRSPENVSLLREVG